MSSEESSTDIYFTSPEDIKGKIRPPVNEGGLIEYNIDDSASSSKTCSMTDEYMLPNSNQESNQLEINSEVQHLTPRMPVIQDEYDENNYCLARSVEDGTATVQSNESNKPKYSDIWFTKRNIIICLLILLFITGGLAIYFGLIRTDTTTEATTKETDSCSNSENSVFTVRFHNLDNYKIDIKEYDNNWNEKIIKSRIQPGDDHTLEVNFTQSFFFKRSDYDKRLKATANGFTSDVFQGCRYKARKGRFLSVDITSAISTMTTRIITATDITDIITTLRETTTSMAKITVKQIITATSSTITKIPTTNMSLRTTTKTASTSAVVTKGPIHTFNGHKVNFYITTGQGWCCNYGKNNATTDAEFFCASFYGPNFNVVSFEIGSYKDSGSMGYQLHRPTCCAPGSASRPAGGTEIEKTSCSRSNWRVECLIWSTEINHSGLYNIICAGTNEYFFIGNGRCMLDNGLSPFRCTRVVSSDISAWGCGEGYCTSLEACIGYTYQTKASANGKHWCMLHTSNGRCPSGYSYNSGQVAAKSKDLTTTTDSNYVCYGRY